MLVGCATSTRDAIAPDVDNAKADGRASRLYLVDRSRVHVDEPSDLAFSAGRLYTVSDRHSKIYEIDDDGDVRGTLDIEAQDLEALAIDGGGSFYVGDESRAKVWRLDEDGSRAQAFEVDTTDGNSGIEGLAFLPDGSMLVAKEKDPATIIQLDLDGTELGRHELAFADDLSAVTYNPSDGLVYGLSDEERKLFRFDADFDLLTSWKLPIDKPEGLAIDGDRVYVVSDAEERIYVFELN